MTIAETLRPIAAIRSGRIARDWDMITAKDALAIWRLACALNDMPPIPHIGPRCSYCGCVPDESHSARCAVTKHGSDPAWGEWASDIKAERDALRAREDVHILSTKPADPA